MKYYEGFLITAGLITAHLWHLRAYIEKKTLLEVIIEPCTKIKEFIAPRIIAPALQNFEQVLANINVPENTSFDSSISGTKSQTSKKSSGFLSKVPIFFEEFRKEKEKIEKENKRTKKKQKEPIKREASPVLRKTSTIRENKKKGTGLIEISIKNSEDSNGDDEMEQENSGSDFNSDDAFFSY